MNASLLTICTSPLIVSNGISPYSLEANRTPHLSGNLCQESRMQFKALSTPSIGILLIFSITSHRTKHSSYLYCSPFLSWHVSLALLFLFYISNSRKAEEKREIGQTNSRITRLDTAVFNIFTALHHNSVKSAVASPTIVWRHKISLPGSTPVSFD